MNVKSEKVYRRNGYDTGSINEIPKVLPSDFNFGSSKEKADLGCEICLVHGGSNGNDTGDGYKIPAGRMSSLLLVIIIN